MTKEQWVNIKRSKQLPLDLFYEYYKLHNTKETEYTKEEFQSYFHAYINTIRLIPTTNVINHYNRELAITSLYDKNNILIREY